jgi:hypothetical protein
MYLYNFIKVLYSIHNKWAATPNSNPVNII